MIYLEGTHSPSPVSGWGWRGGRVGGLVGWLAGWLAGWLVGWLAGWLKEDHWFRLRESIIFIK